MPRYVSHPGGRRQDYVRRAVIARQVAGCTGRTASGHAEPPGSTSADEVVHAVTGDAHPLAHLGGQHLARWDLDGC